jgi:hypothetical protein
LFGPRFSPGLAAAGVAFSGVGDFNAALAFLTAADGLLVAAMIRARPSGIRRRFLLAAFAGAGVAAAFVFRAAAHRFLCAAARRRRAEGLTTRLGAAAAAAGADRMCAVHAVPDALQRTEADLSFLIREEKAHALRNPCAVSAYMFCMMANFTLLGAAAILFLLAGSSPASGQTLDKLQLHNVQAVAAEYRGTKAIHITQTSGAQGDDTLAIVSGSDLLDGVIEVALAGAPAPGAFGDARGFIGVAFRVQPSAAKFELLYLRPSNGRAEDQLRRNHSTQYSSFPDWPWQRTRQETPGLYESYVDLEPGVWTKVKIVLAGGKARLYVHGAEQPCLIVNDLKLSPAKGAIGLWTGPGTDGYFANLHTTPAP